MNYSQDVAVGGIVEWVVVIVVVTPEGLATAGDKPHVPVTYFISSTAMSPVNPCPTTPSKRICKTQIKLLCISVHQDITEYNQTYNSPLALLLLEIQRLT